MTKFFNRSEHKQKRKDLRNNPTKAEKILWNALKGKKLGGHKFRRQYGVGKYVIDFYCVKEKFAVELDGKVHDRKDSKEYDKVRDEFIDNFEIRIMRIKNEAVENDLDSVLEMILAGIKK
ncbi:MAG: endonuclease domain-containing protein [Ignavibacteria bacterium]